MGPWKVAGVQEIPKEGICISLKYLQSTVCIYIFGPSVPMFSIYKFVANSLKYLWGFTTSWLGLDRGGL